MTMALIRFLPEAVEDLLETQRWYGRREPALAGDFADAFAAAVERIRRDPRSFPLIHGQIRDSCCGSSPMPRISVRRALKSW